MTPALESFVATTNRAAALSQPVPYLERLAHLLPAVNTAAAYLQEVQNLMDRGD